MDFLSKLQFTEYVAYEMEFKMYTHLQYYLLFFRGTIITSVLHRASHGTEMSIKDCYKIYDGKHGCKYYSQSLTC